MACATWPTDLGIWVHRVTRACRTTSELEGEYFLRRDLPHQHRFRVESPSIELPVAAVYSPAPKRWNEAHSINFPSLSLSSLAARGRIVITWGFTAGKAIRRFSISKLDSGEMQPRDGNPCMSTSETKSRPRRGEF